MKRMTDEQAMLAALMASARRPGNRYRLGQRRCTARGSYGVIDLSERMNAENTRYLPHQGEREIARRARNIALGRYDAAQFRNGLAKREAA